MATYYVNISAGSDTNPGTEAGPFETISKALSEVSPGDTIFLAKGQTFPSFTISSKVGTALNKYYWDAYGIGNKPVVSAFADPAGSWVDEGSNIWSYYNGSFAQVNALTISGAHQPIGRWPKMATAKYYNIDSASGNSSITDNANLAGAPSFIGGELVSKKRKWTIDRATIDAQTSSTITVLGSGNDYEVGNGYFVQNHVNCCTEQGDWAFDFDNKKVYFYSTSDPNSLDIKLSFEQYAVQLSQSDYHDFSNIVFEGAYDHNVFLSFSHNVSFDLCVSRFAGKNGLQTYVSENATWHRSTMYDINNHGVNNRDASEGVTVTKSSFVRIAAVPGMGQSGSAQQNGVHINNTEHNATIDGNYFFEIGNCGVYYRGDNCYVGHNYAEKCGFTVSDAAAFYSFGNYSSPYTGLVCEYNIAYDCVGNIDGIGGTAQYDTCGFYTDDNCQNITVRYNYAKKCGYCYYIHNNQNVSYQHNIGIDAGKILYISDDNVQGVGTTLRVRNIDVQHNTFKALAGQLLIAARTISAHSGDDPFLYGIINNNQLDAVESTPFNVHLTFNYDNYYDLLGWQSNVLFDLNSNTDPFDDSEVIYLVNDTEVTDTFALTKVYKDWNNIENDTGEVTLEPNESILLFEVEGLYFFTASVSPAGYGTAEVDVSPVREDEEVTFTAAPASGKQFVRWAEDGFEFALQNPLTFTPLLITNRSADLVAEFQDVTTPTFALTTAVNNAGWGTATDLTNAGPYEAEATINLQASPETGYYFVGWTVGGLQVSDQETFAYTMPAEVTTITAVFAQKKTLSLIASPGGSATLSGAGSYQPGAVVSLLATNTEGWTFEYWMKDSQVISTDAAYDHPKTSEDETLYAFSQLTGTSGGDPDPEPEPEPDPEPDPEPTPDPELQQPESNSLYLLNNLHLTNQFGFIPGQKDGSNLAIRGAWDMPARLGKTFHDWGDERGVEPYVDESEIRWGGRDINLYGYICGASKMDGLKRLYSLYDHLAAIGDYFLLESELLGAWNVIVRERIQSSHITEGWYTVDIPFRQPIVYLEGTVPEPSDLANDIGIDGRSFREFGFFLISLDETYDRPKPKNLPLTAWPHEPYRVSPVEHGVIEMEGVFLCDSYAAFKNHLNAFYALLAKPGLRAITIKDEAFRMVFAKDGATVTNVNIEADGQVTAVIKIQLTEGEKPLVDWDYLANEQGDLVLTTEGSKILIVPEGPEIIGYEYLADGFGNLILTPEGDKIIIKTK